MTEHSPPLGFSETTQSKSSQLCSPEALTTLWVPGSGVTTGGWSLPSGTRPSGVACVLPIICTSHLPPAASALAFSHRPDLD